MGDRTRGWQGGAPWGHTDDEDRRGQGAPRGDWYLGEPGYEDFDPYERRRERRREVRRWEGTDPGERDAAFTLRGTHAGKGPRGYRRSDERIREDVSDALTRDPDVDASEIEVQVEDGVVTLTGAVSDRIQKRLAEVDAERVHGVHDVANQLRIRRQVTPPRGDQPRREREA